MSIRSNVRWFLLLVAGLLSPACSAFAVAPSDVGSPGAEEGTEGEAHEVRVARMELEVAREEAAGRLARRELELTLAQRKVAEAERNLQQFALERALELDEARLDLDRSEGRHTDAKLELAELEAMYAEEEFAEKTKELVLSRGRRQEEHAERGLELERRKLEALESHELPQRGRELESELLEARGGLESAERELKSARLEGELAILEAQHALEEALEEAPEVEG